MVKASFKPHDELIIHECQEFELDGMARPLCTGMQAGSIASSLHWAEGIAPGGEPFPQNEEMTRENPQGRTHSVWSSVAEMAEARPSLALRETSVTIPATGVAENPVFGSAAMRLKGAK